MTMYIPTRSRKLRLLYRRVYKQLSAKDGQNFKLAESYKIRSFAQASLAERNFNHLIAYALHSERQTCSGN